MRVKIEEFKSITKVRFESLKPGDIFRKLTSATSLDQDEGEVDDLVVRHPETFYMKLLGVGNSNHYNDKCNAVSLCRASRSHVHAEEYVQPFEGGILTVREVV